MSPLRIGFLMDPIEAIHVDKDTTFVLMLEAQARGHEVLYFRLPDLFVRDSEPWASLVALEVARRPNGDHHRPLGPWREEPLRGLDVVFMRKDPPFDMSYIFATYVLEAIGGKTLVVNDPRGLRDANEKLFILGFPDLTPRTHVTQSPARLRAILDELGGEMVVKPFDGCGGAGVLRVDREDVNLGSLLEMATAGGTRPVLAQACIPSWRAGDKRVILLDGEPIGAVLRVPPAGEFRANIHVGGRCEPTLVGEAERRICRRLAPRLRELGLGFVGIDVIGGLLTEVNVTSPTGVQEINAFDGVKLESSVMGWVERKARGKEGGLA